MSEKVSTCHSFAETRENGKYPPVAAQTEIVVWIPLGHKHKCVFANISVSLLMQGRMLLLYSLRQPHSLPEAKPSIRSQAPLGASTALLRVET